MPGTPYVPTAQILDALETIHVSTVDVLRLMARGPRLLKPPDAVVIAERLASILNTIADLQIACRSYTLPNDGTSA